jgi:glutamate/aspartate transport system substrate-binding protein
MMLLKPLFALACGFALAAGALAQVPQSPTLRKIQETGLITIAYREASVPFSYLDDAQHPIGYSMAICDRIVDAVKARLGLRDLERRYVPVTSATRVPVVADGGADLECGVTTHTADRERRAAFSVTTFVAGIRLLSRRSDPVVHVDDLQGKTVTTAAGTTSVTHLQDLYNHHGITMRIVPVQDEADAFRMVQMGRADAYAMDDVLLYANVAESARPDDYLVSEDALSVEPYAIMIGKDDPVFKHVVDQAIIAMCRSGEIEQLYRRWFESPIPPQGINLRMPMTPVMRRVIAEPTDSPDPEAYR